MIIWLNGAFGSGKTTCAFELNRRLADSFVYDPENAGYFLRSNSPKELHEPDFQDNALWRAFNYDMLKYLSREYAGIIIAPMTVTNRRYYDEIVRRLIDDGVQVHHFILHASRAALIKRLNKRLERGETWAKQQIDRCINAFDSIITEHKIMTDEKSVDNIIEEIAVKSGVTLLPDNRGRLKKKIDRVATLIRHIRG